MYRKCNEVSEKIQHIAVGCKILAPMDYLLMYDHLLQIVHQKLATKYSFTDDYSPYYRHILANVLESNNYKL